MGEIIASEIPFMLLYTRKYIIGVLKSKIERPNDYVALCIAIAQYMALLYADFNRNIVQDIVIKYEAFPMSYAKSLPDIYKDVAVMIVKNRNTFCHALGSLKCIYTLHNYTKSMKAIRDFVNNFLLDDGLIQEDTRKAMGIL